MKSSIFTCLFFFLSVFFNQAHADKDIDTVFKRLKAYYLSKESSDSALIFMRQQNANGSWSGINYNASKGPWPLKHLKNLKAMAIAYNNNEFALKRDSLKDATIKGLFYWYSFSPPLQCKNWWMNDIGNQRQLNTIAVMMWNDIPQILKTQIINNNQEAPSMTGANESWISSNVAIRGILEKDESRIKKGLNGIIHANNITKNEGLQSDYSFFQHGQLLYNGGYGKVVLENSTIWATLVEGTSFAFSKEDIRYISSLALDGTQWFVWKNGVDPLTIGREISRKGKNLLAKGFIEILENLKKLDPDRATESERFINHIKDKDDSSLLGCKYFWNGEIFVKRTSDFYYSIKLASNRIVSAEYINNENKKGYWLGMGMNIIKHQWDDFLNIYPIWDWTKLPGATNFNDLPKMPRRTKNESSFAGGVCGEQNGVAGMILDVPKIRAYKSWFIFDNEIIALGASINSTSNTQVTTTVDQRLIRGNIYSNDKKIPEDFSGELENKIWHDNIGYRNLTNKNFFVSNKYQKGKWKDIGTEPDSAKSKKVLKIWLNHEKKPINSSYSYSISLGIDSLDFFQESPKIILLRNDSIVQAVYDSTTNSIGSIFYAKSAISFKTNYKIEVNAPCILILKSIGDKFVLHIADPLKKEERIQVKIIYNKNNAYRSIFNESIEMPKGEFKGSTKSFVI